MKFVTHLERAQGSCPNDSGDHQTFPVAPPAGQSFHLPCEIYLPDGFTPNFVQAFIVPR